MRKALPWIGAALVLLLVLGIAAGSFVFTLGVGVIGAVQTCGISLLTGTSVAATQSPIPTASASTSPLLTPTASPAASSSSATAAAEAYFNGAKTAAVQAEQRRNAALIVSIGETRAKADGFSQTDIAAAVGVAIQESGLRNLTYGDRDSLGLYQQRPSAIRWGTASQILDVTHAINAFYDALATVKNRSALSMVDLGIAVQNPSKSAYHRGWQWDNIALSIVALYSGTTNDGGVSTSSICLAASGVSSGPWQSPLKPGSYCVMDGFGMRFHPIYHVWKLHSGVDLSCDNGDPIYAVHDGIIKMAGPNGDFGNYVSINNGDGILTGYGHMRGFADGIVPGAKVSAGQVIGYVGATGGATGPHLHFLVSVNGKLIDPVPFMKENGVELK